MIIDKLENISLYKEIPDCALVFIKKLSTDIECRRYPLSSENFANVEVYTTKNVSDTKFESHKNFIDIQLLLSGKERIYFNHINNLVIKTPYDITNDITFYSNPVSDADYVTLDGTNFVMLYPHEAHAPQSAINNIPSDVKKVVIKLKVG